MQTLKAIQYFSGTLPSGETVTLHTGNERSFDQADAEWLLAEYPDRFLVDTSEFTVKASADADAPNSVVSTEAQTAAPVEASESDPKSADDTTTTDAMVEASAQAAPQAEAGEVEPAAESDAVVLEAGPNLQIFASGNLSAKDVTVTAEQSSGTAEHARKGKSKKG